MRCHCACALDDAVPIQTLSNTREVDHLRSLQQIQVRDGGVNLDSGQHLTTRGGGKFVWVLWIRSPWICRRFSLIWDVCSVSCTHLYSRAGEPRAAFLYRLSLSRLRGFVCLVGKTGMIHPFISEIIVLLCFTSVKLIFKHDMKNLSRKLVAKCHQAFEVVNCSCFFCFSISAFTHFWKRYPYCIQAKLNSPGSTYLVQDQLVLLLLLLPLSSASSSPLPSTSTPLPLFLPSLYSSLSFSLSFSLFLSTSPLLLLPSPFLHSPSPSSTFPPLPPSPHIRGLIL